MTNSEVVVLKYAMQLDEIDQGSAPAGITIPWDYQTSKLLHVGCQNIYVDDLPTFWVMQPAAFAKQPYQGVGKRFLVFGTGHPFEPLGLAPVSTVICSNGQLVWHIFEKLTR